MYYNLQEASQDAMRVNGNGGGSANECSGGDGLEVCGWGDLGEGRCAKSAAEAAAAEWLDRLELFNMAAAVA